MAVSRVETKRGEDLTEEQQAEVVRLVDLEKLGMPGSTGTVAYAAVDQEGNVQAYAWFEVVGRQGIGMGIVGNRGHGRNLAEYCMMRAKELGATHAMAAVHCDERVLMWHLRLGYMVCGYADSYYPDGQAAVMMRREL